MSNERPAFPWWYSGDDAESEAGHAPGTSAPSEPEPSLPAGMGDLMAMAGGLVGWAADRVLAPHAEHDDPGEHPTCLLCRAQRFMGEGSGPADVPAAPSENHAAESVTRTPGVIQWLPIDDQAHGREWNDDPVGASDA